MKAFIDSGGDQISMELECIRETYGVFLTVTPEEERPTEMFLPLARLEELHDLMGAFINYCRRQESREVQP